MELKYKNWDEININVFQKLQELFKLDKTGDEQIDNLNISVGILAILCDVDEDVISDLSIDEFKRLSATADFINNMPKAKIKDNYKINGNVYDVQLNVEDMTMNQYMDFQTFCKDKDKYMREILACFLIPRGKKYCDGYKVKEVIEEIGNHLSIVDAYSICFFFTLLFQSLTKATLACLVKKMKREKKKMNKEQQVQVQRAIDEVNKAMNLVKSGVGLIG